VNSSSPRKSRRPKRPASRVVLLIRRVRSRLRRLWSGWPERLRRRQHEVGIDEPRRWRSRKTMIALWVLSYGGAALLLLWIVRAAYVLATGGSDFTGLNLETRCSNGMTMSCGALTGFILPWLSVALATALFLFRRLRRVPRPRQKTAIDKPHKLVPTAGSIAGEVVGRDEVCKVLIDNLHTGHDRRPHLIVGGVGTGKTAVIVQLVRLLAEHRAIPVVIRMRDADRHFSFRRLACDQFQREIGMGLLSSAEGDKIWRYLCKDDRVIVLADGLEEALSRDEDRDDHIRIAITQARKENLPLVIASRPHDSLRGMDASILDLEPLSEEAALHYLERSPGRVDPRRIDWIVETAGVTEAPLYLRIAQELTKERLLNHLVMEDEPTNTLDTRNLDRSGLRRNLLDTWRAALTRGRLYGDLPLTPEQRTATVAFISVLACIGLLNDQLEVRYADALASKGEAVRAGRGRRSIGLGSPGSGFGRPALLGRRPATTGSTAQSVATSAAMPSVQQKQRLDRFAVEPLSSWLQESLAPLTGGLRGEVNVRLAAAWGTQLGLVEVRGEAVRFQHSVLQAYLGALALESLLERDDLLREAFRAPRRPGRELLIALVLLSRGRAGNHLVTGAPHSESGSSDDEGRRAEKLVYLLQGQVHQRTDSKALDILAAAMEIDALVPLADEPRRSMHRLAKKAADHWLAFGGSDLRTLEEAKIGFVLRFGEALRTVDRTIRADARRKDHLAGEKAIVHAAYRELFRIGYLESSSYPVRHTVAQELGAGGRTAFDALRKDFASALQASKTDAWHRSEDNWRKVVLSAWLAPLLYEASPRDRAAEGTSARQSRNDSALTPAENLRCWIGRVGRPELRDGPIPEERGETSSAEDTAEQAAAEQTQRAATHWQRPAPALPLSIDVALAQGFKYAANRREQHPRAHGDVRTYLAEYAVELLRRSGFWFSQLTLIQALGLWALPDLSDGAGARIPGPSTRGVREPDLRARVRRWVEIAGDLRDEGREPRNQGDAPSTHPFVEETGELVIRALETGRPERFMWIDEHGITSKIGASAIDRAELRKHALWIPPSIGWSALDRRAQQLVADVLLLMNLADRGDDARLREDRLMRANRRDLPLCLTGARHPLDPNRKIVVEGSQPGKNCPGDCEFDLCPYPPKGHVNYHAELTETFFDHSPRRRTARWQETPRSELRQFWREMGKRARR
jgi:hypothetical protein